MARPRPLLRLFAVFFKQTIQCLQQINMKNVHPVYSAGIRIHDLLNTSCLPLPLDQGSRPYTSHCFAESKDPLIKTEKGSGCGSVGRAVASYTRGPRFESSHRQKFIYIEHLYTVNCVLKRRK